MTVNQEKIYLALTQQPQNIMVLAELLNMPQDSIKVQICKMRKAGIDIKTSWGRGYYKDAA